jgi:undecaprenyl diphosphate synthase
MPFIKPYTHKSAYIYGGSRIVQWFRTLFSFSLKQAPAPIPLKHLALIMDGNRRWARKHHLATSLGHKKGTDTIKRLIEFCLERTIEIVSVYTFSLENFNRSQEEINALFSLMIEEAQKILPDLKKQGVKVSFIGDKAYFPAHVISTIEHLEAQTKDLKKLHFNILFCYGGRQEIIAAMNTIIQDVQAGVLQKPLTDETFEKYLWSNTIPDPDLIIRTGGVKRLSNFLLYKAAYSELYFTDRLWPDLSKEDLDEALRDFAARKRNFGS